MDSDGATLVPSFCVLMLPKTPVDRSDTSVFKGDSLSITNK